MCHHPGIPTRLGAVDDGVCVLLLHGLERLTDETPTGVFANEGQGLGLRTPLAGEEFEAVLELLLEILLPRFEVLIS